MDESFEDDRSFIEIVQDLILTPFRILTSLSSRRFYVRTVLIILTGAALLGLSFLAYLLFYNTYIPTLGLSLPIHLQFDPANARHPYGIVPLPRQVFASQQPYDVKLLLCLPRTRDNVDAGNFMLELELLAEYSPAVNRITDLEKSESLLENPSLPTKAGHTRVLGPAERSVAVLRRAARPAVLTHSSPIVDSILTIFRLPLFILGWRREDECLDVTIMDEVGFERGWRNVPAMAKVEIVSSSRMQLYSVMLEFRAQFGGLRWLMYNHRIISAFMFTSLFWIVSMFSTIAVWSLASYLLPFSTSSETPLAGAAIKQETAPFVKVKSEDGLSSESNFKAARDGLSLASSPYTRSGPAATRIKTEDVDDEDEISATKAAEEYNTITEADDEDEDDEDADFVLNEPLLGARGAWGSGRDDSGLGTSLESSGPGGRTAGIARRRKGME